MTERLEAPRALIVGTRLAPPVELLKWLHEERRRSYEEDVNAPAFHALWSWLRRVPVELPLVVAPEGATGGLKAAVLAFDESCRPGERIFGDLPEERQRGLALFDTLDRLLFRQAVALYYHFMLEAPEAVLPGALDGAPAWQAFLVRTFYDRWRAVMRRGLALDTFDVDRARASIDEAFAVALDSRPAGADFIGGTRPGPLDVVFAALSSPLLLPERHGGRPPSPDVLPAAFRAIVEHYRASDAGRLALAIYRTRPAPQPALRRPGRGWSSTALPAAAPLLRGAARLAARIGPRQVTFRNIVAVFRWQDVTSVLDRDGDFRIGPVNASRIEAVSGPFILGMDRSTRLFAQRGVAYGALQTAGRSAVQRVLREEPRRVLDAAGARYGAIEVVNGYARPIAARSAAALFGIAGPSEAAFMRTARAVFHETFLNLTGDRAVQAAGIEAGRELRGWIDDAVVRRRAGGQAIDDVLGALLALADRGDISEQDVACVAAGLLVGAIDTTATAVANIMAELVADRPLMARVQADRDRFERLSGWCREILRRRPHNPVLLRRAAPGATSCGKSVPADATIVAVTLAAMQDPRVFDDPAHLRPDRPEPLYLHFGRGLHLCAGRDINALQIPILVGELLRREPRRKGPLRNRGPFMDELVVELGATP
ncbi:MAG: cytochrome P450 [Reyranellaceae bacterium]